MNEQPEALRIADELLALHGPTDIDERAAAKLRRQHDRIIKLEAALQQAVEALELYQSKMSVEMFDAAITAAKQALGEA